MQLDAELALVGVIATVCTFTIAFWIQHIDRLWEKWAKERRALAEGTTVPNPEFFLSLGKVARQSQYVILSGVALIVLSIAWLVWVAFGLPKSPVPGTLLLALGTISFELATGKIWWKEFALFRAAMERDHELFSHPLIAWTKQESPTGPGGRVIAVAVPNGLDWSRIVPIPGATMPVGPIQAGDTIQFQGDGPHLIQDRDGFVYARIAFHAASGS